MATKKNSEREKFGLYNLNKKRWAMEPIYTRREAGKFKTSITGRKRDALSNGQRIWLAVTRPRDVEKFKNHYDNIGKNI